MKRALILFLSLTAASAFAEGEDKRQALQLSEYQRSFVLEEMRALLSGTQNILVALSANDMDAVAKYARPLGMAMQRNAGGHLHGALPMEFMKLGMATHQDFDLIATDAESIRDPGHTLQQLGQTMGKCVACHATYQLRAGMEPLATADKSPAHAH